MIEFKNASKIYKSKKGVDTLALNNITLKLGNKGMVFIVGKSGSGKSTMLNVLGGLDNLTSGKLIVNGKSTSNFTDKDYDAYRNTYIGFIFQEFNVLEEYNVFENVELALRLQSQKVSISSINNLLEKLGLNDLGTRNINELSGGQKQRVAIARALIKKPQIILADEPTGNLDKQSGEEVFNILKNISKEKLVVVVSHDIESANKYADRIIEIEDGNIISDSVEKVDEEIDNIELKKSKLPFKYSLKMAVTSFKVKPLKLFMTVLLTAISLVFMALTLNSVLFDDTMLITNTMKDNDNYVYSVSKVTYEAGGAYYSNELTNEDIENLKSITNANLNLNYTLIDNGTSLGFITGEKVYNSSYYIVQINNVSFVEITDDRLLGKVIGKIPEKSNEIAVHKYFADYVIKYGILDAENNMYFPASYEELVNANKELKLGDNKVIIVGIMDEDLSLFEKAKETGRFENDKLRQYYSPDVLEKASTVYVKGFSENAILNIDKNSIIKTMNLTSKNKKGENEWAIVNKTLTEEVNVITSNNINVINSLNKDEVIISIETLRKFDSNFDTQFNKYLEEHRNGTYDELLNEFTNSYINSNLLRVTLHYYDSNVFSDYFDVSAKVVGISLDGNNYVSNKYVDEYSPRTKVIHSAYVYDDDIKNLTKSLNSLVFIDYVMDSDMNLIGASYSYTIDNALDITNVMATYKFLSPFILAASLIFLVFTFLLFSNFIALSISYNKKEIGILRALGASNNDVIKIFSYESIIIGILSWVVSIIGWLLVSKKLNTSIFGSMYYTLNGIVIHPLVPIILFVYVMAIALFITIASISKINKIKPIDAILNK